MKLVREGDKYSLYHKEKGLLCIFSNIVETGGKTVMTDGVVELIREGKVYKHDLHRLTIKKRKWLSGKEYTSYTYKKRFKDGCYAEFMHLRGECGKFCCVKLD
jgi:hypothetical protein